MRKKRKKNKIDWKSCQCWYHSTTVVLSALLLLLLLSLLLPLLLCHHIYRNYAAEAL
jgi:hypothetical protein